MSAGARERGRKLGKLIVIISSLCPSFELFAFDANRNGRIILVFRDLRNRPVF